jgi:methylenetetrahydrofolate dehydrogenase (NADP+)/methenyltetrahydrofolate cyclohydrolase
MSATILSGLTARNARIPALIEKVGGLARVPTLAIIQIGDRSDSTSYVKAKKNFADKIGVSVRHIHLTETVSQDEVLKEIAQCNTDVSVQGIIVQLPLPAHIDRIAMIEAVTPAKDVDGLTTVNQDKLLAGDISAIVPATARGIQELFSYYSISLIGLEWCWRTKTGLTRASCLELRMRPRFCIMSKRLISQR